MDDTSVGSTPASAAGMAQSRRHFVEVLHACRDNAVEQKEPPMPTDDDQVRYNEEDKKVVTDYARMAAKYPDTMDDLRAALRTSATLIVSDRPEMVSEFRRLAEEVDSFLRACQTGEADPHRFLQTMERGPTELKLR